jgi:acyl transferase domain-containing protein/phosphopantetheinyl transferase (holo-ACP synthase)
MSGRARPLDAAIVGMACRFPGAPDLFAYWDNVLAGRPSIRDVPADRWDADEFFDPTSAEGDRVGGRRGGYLDEPIAFDAAASGIMPRTVEGGEPEQFLVLDCARAALADAGLPDGPRDGRRVEVVIGRGNYFNRGNLTRLQHGRVLSQTLAILRALHPEWSDEDLDAVRSDLKAALPPFEAATIPGQLTNATAGRLAHRLDLGGPCFVVDAASASSLVALELGARALAGRRADLAIVGGVYIEADVDFPMVFSRLGVLSRSGTPRPFAADADGMVPGEGAGVVVLKRLADAERDGDRVYAVVKGVGLASDGRGPGLAAPSARGHLRAIRRAYRASGVDPATVGLIEGHGLGVPAADRAELKALRAAFPPVAGVPARVLGAASALIGHAMPAAGMAGLIKAALALHHRALPASQGAEAPHPGLARSPGAFRLNPATRPWVQGADTPRRAGVNAFGFAGINAHAVLEDHPASAEGRTPGALARWPDEAVLLAAPSREALARRARSLADALRGRDDLALKDVAYTVSADSRGSDDARLGLVASSIDDLVARLDAVAPRLDDPARDAIRDGKGAYFWARPLARAGGLAFLFPGEGSQYPGMLADLCLHFPEVRALFDTSDRLARESGAIEPPSERLFGGRGTSELWETGTAVNVVLSSQWAIHQLLGCLGLRPDAVAGHSSGEFLAMAAAGAVAVDRRLEERFNDLAALFAEVEAGGAVPGARLLAAATNRARAEAAVGDEPVRVAVDNCPHQVVLAGPGDAVGRVADRLRASGVPCEDLPFGRAYHTPAFEPALGPVRRFFGSLEVRPPARPLYSCGIAGRMPGDPDAIRRLAVEQWTRPVEFRRTIEAMHADGFAVFVDVGARGHLAGFVEDTLRGRAAFAVASQMPGRPGLTQLNHLVASLFAQGATLDPSFLHARRRPRRLELDAPPRPRTATVPIRLGFPAMALSPDMAARLRDRRKAAVDPRPASSTGEFDPYPILSERIVEPRPDLDAVRRGVAPAEPDEDDDGAMTAYLGTMRAFLDSQHRVMTTYFGPPMEHTSPDVALAEPEARGGSRDAIVEFLTLDADGDPVAEHHTFGGRRISAVDPGMKGLPVLPFTVMAEMLAKAAARLAPGLRLVGLREVRARRWVRYEDAPSTLEVRAERVPGRPNEIRASLFNRGVTTSTPVEDDRPDVEGVVLFDDRREPPPPASPFDLGDAEPSRFTAASLYGEQWLFHGPALRAVVGVGSVSMRGIEGTLRVLPRRGLCRPGEPPPLTDPIVLDAFTHLLGCWGLDRLAEADVIFPLRLGSLEVFGEDPPEGTDLGCRITVHAIERLRVNVSAEIVRPDGRVWMRIGDWDDWRFDWPPRYRDVFRMPDRVLLGEPLREDGEAVAVWLRPPGDMARPVWRDVLERVQLSPEERAGCLRPAGPEERRTLRLFGRIAAKEAARRLWLAEGGPPVYPADLTIETDAHGRPVLRSRAEPSRAGLPAVSIAHADGVAVAIAARDPAARVGIDVARVADRGRSFEAAAFTDRERTLLDRLGGDRPSWAARLWCAKEAAAKATGRASVVGPSGVVVVDLDPSDGAALVRPGDDLAAACPDLRGRLSKVETALREEFAWAWTLGRSIRS